MSWTPKPREFTATIYRTRFGYGARITYGVTAVTDQYGCDPRAWTLRGIRRKVERWRRRCIPPDVVETMGPLPSFRVLRGGRS